MQQIVTFALLHRSLEILPEDFTRLLVHIVHKAYCT